MRPARARSEEMTMQQLMGMMQGLQEAMAASQARNDELHRSTHCAHRQLGHTVLATQYFRPSSEHPVTVFRYGGVSPLMFLAS